MTIYLKFARVNNSRTLIYETIYTYHFRISNDDTFIVLQQDGGEKRFHQNQSGRVLSATRKDDDT